MNVIYVGLLMWPFIWLGVFCFACYSLMKWNWHGWRDAFKSAWECRYQGVMLLPGLSFLGFSMALSLALWIVGIIPS